MSGTWQPDYSLTTARTQARLLALARQYFSDADVLEVQTPSLSSAAVSDVHIESLSANVQSREHYLHTSPEYAMKRLLAAGFPDIYQICRVYRNGESGQHHQPEFTLLEWYRHEFSLGAIIDDTTSLIRFLLDNAGSALHGTLTIDPPQPYDDALRDACGLDSDSPLSELARTAPVDFPADWRRDRNALLGYLFDTHVARHLPTGALTTITHYPASQAALAQIDPETNRALRFEVYCGAIELANGFVELRDADEQRARFAHDLRQRQQQGLRQRPLDSAFLDALASGLPDCAGVAVGFERLLMLATGQYDIRDTVAFAHRHE